MKPQELLANWIEGATHGDRQVDARGVHLTVAEIMTAHSRGKLDYGGTEFAPASSHSIMPLTSGPAEKYGWWRLDEGCYMVRFNERLKVGAPPSIVVADQHLAHCNCTLTPAIVTEGEIRSTLIVSPAGASIKQFAQIALLWPLADV